MSSGRIGSGGKPGFGLRDAQPFSTDIDDYVRKGAYFQSLTGVAITRMGNGDWFYAVDATSGNVLVTLPPFNEEVGHHHIVKRLADGTSNQVNITAAPDPSGTVGMEVTATHSIAVDRGVRAYFSDGSGWRTVSNLSQTPGGEVASGTYTPTLTGVTNIGAVAAFQCQWMRVGTVVTVSGRADAKPTANATFSEVGISLPIASNISAFNDLGGGGAALGNPSTQVGIGGDATNDRASMRFVSEATATYAFAFSFTYRVIV